MSVEHVSGLPQFQTILRESGNKLVVVDFHAVWCGPCRAIAPHYESLARRYQGRARFLKIDVDEAQDVARSCSVSAMPTFHFYSQGKRVADFSGADPGKLDQTIEQYAPSSAEVSFSGEGQRLGDGPTPASASASSQPQPQGSSMREAAAIAAARRMQQPPTTADASTNGSSSTEPSDKPASKNDAKLKVNEKFARQMIDEMGFPRVRAEKALILTGNKSLEDAVEWCFEHADDVDIDEPLQVVTDQSPTGEAPAGNGTVAEGASSSNAPPKQKLSVEESKKRADELYAKARAKREAEEKRDAIEREKNRLKSGKEVTMMRAKLEDAERKRAVEERRRQKREELAERQRVRQMLEADKEARRQKFRMPNADPSSKNSAPRPAPVAQAKPQRPPQASASAGKIQFRLPDGTRVEGDFTAEQTMADLISYLTAIKPELASSVIKLSQQYPRKVFSQAEYRQSLGELKLLPRGALTVSLS